MQGYSARIQVSASSEHSRTSWPDLRRPLYISTLPLDRVAPHYYVGGISEIEPTNYRKAYLACMKTKCPESGISPASYKTLVGNKGRLASGSWVGTLKGEHFLDLLSMQRGTSGSPHMNSRRRAARPKVPAPPALHPYERRLCIHSSCPH